MNANINSCSECACYLVETCAAGVTHVFIGDGVCNDETNIVGCDYDGLDCCGSNVDIDHCTDCACHGKEIFIDIRYYYFKKHFFNGRTGLGRVRTTVKLDIKKLLNKEQIGFKKLFTDYQLFYTMNLLLNKELLPI